MRAIGGVKEFLTIIFFDTVDAVRRIRGLVLKLVPSMEV